MINIGEFSLIDSIRELFPISSGKQGIKLGIGDDAASIQSHKNIIISKDLFVENVHFKTQYYSMKEIGYKSLIVNISDIAAMGAKPLYFLMGICLPKYISDNDVFQILEGLREASGEYELSLIGGDISRSSKELMISITILGSDIYGIAKRSTAKIGDSIYISGYAGNSSAGLELLQNQDLEGKLQESHKRPRARTDESLLLMKEGIPESMIDISDGLVADLYHILEESGSGGEIYKELIPISKELLNMKGLCRSPYDYALYGGEDYEILFTSSKYPRKNIELFDKRNKRVYKYYYIGNIIKDEKQRLYLKEGNSRYCLEAEGYRHF